MLEGDEWKADYPHKDDEGPEAKLARELYAKHLQWRVTVEQAIRDLHASLPVKSSDFDLFSFEEMRMWGLKHCRKRAKDVNNDHEADGA